MTQREFHFLLNQSSSSTNHIFTNVIIGLSNVIIPHRDIQSLLGQFTVFDVIAEFLKFDQDT